MRLELKDNLFVVTGATSGFGRAILMELLKEGAHIIINARGEDRLIKLKEEFPEQIEIVAGNITTDATLSLLIRKIGNRKLHGIVINAGGPPAGSFLETELEDWDRAYAQVLRWKVKLTKLIIPLMIDHNYGRIVFIESVSVKQAIPDLVLSNSLRMAVVGFVKTLSLELAKNGITLNIMAPGYHDTEAMERLYKKQSINRGIELEEARAFFEEETAIGRLGDPEEFASLAIWLLSEKSAYITGQTISVDGGFSKSNL